MIFARRLLGLGALGLCVIGTGPTAPSSPLLSNPDLFRIVAAMKNAEAFRLAGTWSDACDSLPPSTKTPLDCFQKTAKVRSSSAKAVPSLIGVLARCTWVRYRGQGLPDHPTLGFELWDNGLGVDLVVWLAERRATLSRRGEATYAAAIPESLIMDVAWCLWGVDPENPRVVPRIEAEMRRRGLSPTDAPPPDVRLVDDVVRDVPVVDEKDAMSVGEFVYYEDAPTPVTRVPPVYPEMAKEAGIEGRVVLHVLVGKDGRVKMVKVIRSVTMLDQAAVAAVKKWVFKPALSNKKPVAVWVEVPVEFPPR